jgi:hypothetical protein
VVFQKGLGESGSSEICANAEGQYGRFGVLIFAVLNSETEMSDRLYRGVDGSVPLWFGGILVPILFILVTIYACKTERATVLHHRNRVLCMAAAWCPAVPLCCQIGPALGLVFAVCDAGACSLSLHRAPLNSGTSWDRKHGKYWLMTPSHTRKLLLTYWGKCPGLHLL